MKRLFDCADRYIQSRDWRMLAGLKFCLCAMGMLLGLAVPEKQKNPPQPVPWACSWQPTFR